MNEWLNTELQMARGTPPSSGSAPAASSSAPAASGSASAKPVDAGKAEAGR
jgi:hypothetical protein